MVLELVKEIPQGLNRRAIEDTVMEFILETSPDVDPKGMYDQTLERIAMATFLNAPGWEFWIAHKGGEVTMYSLANITKDVDNRLCYWINQLWLKKEYRHDRDFAKQIWGQLKKHARERLCSHVVMASVRDGWAKFLNDDVQPYLTLLKKDLED